MAEVELSVTVSRLTAEHGAGAVQSSLDHEIKIDQSKRSTQFATVLSNSGLDKVASEDGKIVHRLEHTLIGRLYGVDKAKRAIQLVMHPMGMAFIGFFTVLGGVFLYLAFASIIPPALFIAYTWVLMVMVAAVHFIMFDLRLVKLLCKQWLVWIVFLSAIGQNASLYGLMGYDWRAAGGFIFIMMSNVMRSLVEATPSYYRVWLAGPGAIVLVVTNLLVLIFVNLNRFGNMYPVTYQISSFKLVLPTAWNYELIDLFNSCTIVLLAVYFKWLYNSLCNWRQLHLTSFTVALLAEDDYAGVDAAPWFMRIATFSGVSPSVFERKTQV